MPDSSRREEAKTSLERRGLRAVTRGFLPTRFAEEPKNLTAIAQRSVGESAPLTKRRQAQPALMPLIDQGRPFRRRLPNSRHGRPSEVGTPVVPSSKAAQAAKRCGLPGGLDGRGPFPAPRSPERQGWSSPDAYTESVECHAVTTDATFEWSPSDVLSAYIASACRPGGVDRTVHAEIENRTPTRRASRADLPGAGS
jgi:hypothetical protein